MIDICVRCFDLVNICYKNHQFSAVAKSFERIKVNRLMKLEDRIYLIKVRLDEAAMQKVTLEDGNLISKEDFIKISQDLKLLDFGGPMGEKRKTASVVPRKDKRSGDTEAVNVSF